MGDYVNQHGEGCNHTPGGLRRVAERLDPPKGESKLFFSDTFIPTQENAITYIRPPIDGKLGIICKHLSEMSVKKWGYICISNVSFAFDLEMYRETGGQEFVEGELS